MLLAAELKLPMTLVPACMLTAEERTGKFCKPLGPVSGSPASFAVMPLLYRSMPKPPLLTTLLPSSVVPVPLTTAMPEPTFWRTSLPLNRLLLLLT